MTSETFDDLARSVTQVPSRRAVVTLIALALADSISGLVAPRPTSAQPRRPLGPPLLPCDYDGTTLPCREAAHKAYQQRILDCKQAPQPQIPSYTCVAWAQLDYTNALDDCAAAACHCGLCVRVAPIGPPSKATGVCIADQVCRSGGKCVDRRCRRICTKHADCGDCNECKDGFCVNSPRGPGLPPTRACYDKTGSNRTCCDVGTVCCEGPDKTLYCCSPDRGCAKTGVAGCGD